MRKNPERIAWTVLWAAFVTFCVLVTGIPLGVRALLRNSQVTQPAQMRVIEGTVLVQKANAEFPLGVTASDKATALAQGDDVITDGTSWAALDLFDRSNAILYGNSRVRLARMETPRFRVSPRPNAIDLSLSQGLLRVGVALPGQRSTQFRVLTPHTTVALAEGSYRIEVTNEGTRVTVVRGQAEVRHPANARIIPQGHRTWVDLSGAPANPEPAARNLVANGDFQQPLATGWMTNTVSLDPDVRLPSIKVIEDGGRKVAQFIRREADDGVHSEAAIEQRLDLDLRDYTRLVVSLDVRLDFQSLSGGGLMSSEFPIIVRLDYKDRWNNDQFWTHGFYYQNQQGYAIGPDAWGQPLGERIPRSVWYPYESGNLLADLGDNRPAQLTRIKIYGSGWNYEGRVSEVQLVVE